MATWRERLVADTTDMAAKIEASSWQRCAIGEQRALHPDVVVYRPVMFGGQSAYTQEPADATLRVLGLQFMDAVQANQSSLALTILDRIEDRVLELKRGPDAV